MLYRAAAERGERIAAFEHRDHAAAGVAIGNGLHLLGYPGVVGIGEAQHRHVVLGVRVEAGGEDDELGLEALERRQPDFVDRVLQFL